MAARPLTPSLFDRRQAEIYRGYEIAEIPGLIPYAVMGEMGVIALSPTLEHARARIDRLIGQAAAPAPVPRDPGPTAPAPEADTPRRPEEIFDEEPPTEASPVPCHDCVKPVDDPDACDRCAYLNGKEMTP